MIRVLIVDDDKLARKGLISIVPWEECGMEIVGEAANGEKALEFLQGHAVDLAVVDIAMPIMTGLQFIEKSQRQYPHMHYVVLSFHEDFENVQSALRLGTLDYISKMRLDQQDCVKVFKRAAEIISGLKAETEQTQAPVSQEKNGTMHEIADQWKSFYWLFSEEAFEEAANETLRENPPLKQMEHLLVRIADIAGKEYGCLEAPDIPEIRDIRSAIRWIADFKGIISDSILKSRDHQNTNLCMFHAVCYIREHLSENISIHMAAQHVGLSRSYFASNFKKIVGLTFNHFLRRERVKRAKSLLESGQANHTNVAQLVGYEDEKYFAHLFFETVGLTPAEYRQSLKDLHA